MMITSSVEVNSGPIPMLPKHHRNVRFYSTKTFRLLCMLMLIFSFFFVELVVGNVTHSLALLADAFHMLSDVLALIIGLVAVRMAKRRSDINTYGWARAEVVGANINTVLLLTLSLTIVFNTIERYIQPEPIVNVNLLIIVGSIGLGINIMGLFLFQGFHGHSHGSASHGHSHGDKSHGHSHNGKSHGHSHGDNDRSIVIDLPKTTLGSTHDSESNDDSIKAASHDMASIGAMTGSTEFKRHSVRALEEAMVDCATHASGFSQSPPDVSAQATLPSLSSADLGDSTMKRNKKSQASSMNMHGVFLHILADALGSIAVIISSLIIKFVPHNIDDHKHWTIYVDPTLSLIIVILITISTIPLLKESTFILLQTVPKEIKVLSLKRQLLDQVPEINGIHELHVWRLTSNTIIASAHLRRQSLSDYMTVADKVKQFFHGVGIHSTTIQYEYQEDESEESLVNNKNENEVAKSECLIWCKDDSCDKQTCCTKDLVRTNAMLSTNNTNVAQKKSTNTPDISIEMIGEQSHDCTTCDHTRMGASNDGFTDEKF